MQNTEVNPLGVEVVHVAVGVIYNDCGQVLIALRKKGQHQGGLWEFPGGKFEAGETCQQALVRELSEELGITAQIFEPLIKIFHSYPDKAVLLDVWSITQFEGAPAGREGQDILWADTHSLSSFDFPSANIPIVTAVQLPDSAVITGGFDDVSDLIYRASVAIEKGAGLLQLRFKSKSDVGEGLLSAVQSLCKDRGVKLVVNSSIKGVSYGDELGLHLTSRDLLSLDCRPVRKGVLLGASCHDQEQVEHAQKIGVDYVFLSPVASTPTHPGFEPLGFERFSKLCETAKVPVYALGGMSLCDLDQVKRCGGQGIAAIRGLWS